MSDFYNNEPGVPVKTWEALGVNPEREVDELRKLENALAAKRGRLKVLGIVPEHVEAEQFGRRLARKILEADEVTGMSEPEDMTSNRHYPESY